MYSYILNVWFLVDDKKKQKKTKNKNGGGGAIYIWELY